MWDEEQASEAAQTEDWGEYTWMKDAEFSPYRYDDALQMCIRDSAITFTNKAAGELRDRLNVACGPQAADLWAHTFHSACTRILRRDIDRLGYSKSFTIYDEDDKKRMLTGILKDLDIDEKKFELRGISSEISRAKDNLVDPAEYEELAGSDYYKRIVSRVYTAYQKRMLSANALDFDDIIFKTVELLRGFADVREYYQNKFRYVLVDEYQDTNHAQYVPVSYTHLLRRWRAFLHPLAMNGAALPCSSTSVSYTHLGERC